MCWRDGLHQADHYLDLFSIILNSAAFSLPHLQYLIATLMTDNTWLLTPTAACPEQGTSSLFSYHLQVHSTYSGMKTEGAGGRKKKDQCTNLSMAPSICFHRMWNTLFARMQDSPYIKATRKGKILPLSLQRHEFNCIQHKENLYMGCLYLTLLLHS